MTKRIAGLALLSLIFCVTASAQQAGPDPFANYLTLDSLLKSKGLTRADVEFKDPKPEDVFDPITRGIDPGKVVSQVWTKRREVRPARPAEFEEAQPVRFADGTQVFKTDKVGETWVSEKKPVNSTTEIVVREKTNRTEEKKVTESKQKQYVTRGQ